MRRISLAWLTLALAASAITVGIGYSYSGHKWSVRQVPYYINPTNSDVSASAAIAAIQYGASAWSTQSNADFSFYYMGQTSGNSIVNNGKNEVFFRNETNSSIAQTYRWWNSAGELVDTDIVFWDASWKFFTGYSGCSGGYYIEEIATHEFGHALGLNHSDVSTATMVAGAYTCATWKGSLDPDDLAAVEAVYPPDGTNSAPVVSISAPTSGTSVTEGSVVTFSGTATDLEEGNLSTSLAWTSSLEGPLGGGGSFSRTLSAGTHTITASVSDSQGSTASKHVTVTVTATANSAPSVTISSPSNNATFAEGTALSFSGSAADPEDGNLSGHLVWTSSRDGHIGTGGSFSRVLSTGSHTITAKVTDSAGATVQAQRAVTVEAPTVPTDEPSSGLTLQGRGYKVKGSQFADLTWSGFGSGSIDVYRDGKRVATTPNDGAHTDAVNRKGGGSSTYKVCAASTSTCSNLITVQF